MSTLFLYKTAIAYQIKTIVTFLYDICYDPAIVDLK